ncbi:MAG: hypothetical protein AAF849_24920 [Bacteroidota bacterium]
MKYSKIIFLGIAFFAVFSLMAQDDKLAVGVGPFGILAPMPEGEARELYYLVSKPLSRSKCVRLVSNSAWDVIMEAREKQTGIDFKNSPTFEQGKAVGAQKIIIGDVTGYKATITPNEEKERDDKRIEISFTLMAVDVTSTATDAIENFTVRGEDTYVAGKLVQSAYQICKRQAENLVKKFFNDAGIKVSFIPFENCGGGVENIPHWKLYSPNGSSGYINDKDKKINKLNRLIYVVEYSYSFEDQDGKTGGIAREEILEMKIEDYQGDRIKLVSRKKKLDLNAIMKETEERISQDPNNGEPQFYIMFKSDFR